MFRRRDPLQFWARAREVLSPRKGWARGFEYLSKRMQRLPDTPHRIALGFACGVQASFTPFFGFHFIVSAAFALLVRGNLLASATGTFFGNPLTFPIIAVASMELGQTMTGLRIETPEDGLSFGWLWDNLDAIFVPYLVGGFLPGLATSTLCYLLLRPLVAAYQDRRRRKLMARAKDRMKRAVAARRDKAEARAAARANDGGAAAPDGG
ncbi:MAG: DUF2062 domain-containing protein [Pseudomonadota bacterium]